MPEGVTRLRWLSRVAGVLLITFTFGPPAITQHSGGGSFLSGGGDSETASAPMRGDAKAGYRKPEFVGIYCADGKFRKLSRIGCSSSREPSRQGLRPPHVPGSIDLDPAERVVEDYEPPAHAVRAAKGHSLMASLIGSLLTFAYGREKVLQSPTHVTTDSRQRLIVTDPELPAVHILDITSKSSFRITGGPQHRLQMPTGVAIDGNDNIYLADGKKGVVLVYDPQGRFLRYIGSFQDESLFQSPSGIAIDRKAGRLYVVDPPARQLVMLDLQGTVLKKVGNRRTQPDRVRFDYPAEVALAKDQVLVLDSAGSRIQIFDLECNFQKAFTIRTVTAPPVVTEIGLALDSASNIYVSNLLGSTVRIYGRNGTLLGVLGKNGLGDEEFNVPSGLWIDPAGRMYVADTKNSRVQVFHLAAQGD
ncbi:MAG TPA: hypothetical protein VJX16_08820 [Terriglobales bacterium]|nr:hypothetical protein [Terriglobales bacterium]